MEIKKNKSQTDSISNDSQKWFYFASNTTFITLIPMAFSNFIITFPVMCKYFFTLHVASHYVSRISLTYYQIVRLQYCFSSSQVHSTKYGYSKWIFIGLYIWGIIVTISILIMSIPILVPSAIGEYGCIIDASFSNSDFTLRNVVIFIDYAVWDLCVLMLYIYKVFQIYTNTNFSDDNIYKKIKYILYKITILTLIYEIFGTSFLVSLIFFQDKHSTQFYIMYPIIYAFIVIEILLTAGVLYLMIEHNDQQYQKLMRMCCGYRGWMIDQDDEQQNMVTNNINPDETVDTGTVNPVETQMITQKDKNIELSVDNA